MRTITLALIALLAQSQGQPPPPQPQPRFRGGTNLVRVDVFATKDGTPVQDLTAADFDVSEDGAPQKIDTFEHIVVDSSHRAERVDPSSVSQANQMAADPHRRVFVVYLDIENVEVSGSHDIKEPLIDFVNRVMGDDDLLAVMTPEMSPSQLTFGRKTDVIEHGLRENWAWGRRDTIALDKRERLYDQCFPPQTGESSPSALARELIKRRRERMVLESLRDLVHHMEALRDGRTAVIAVTDGWLLYRPNENIAKRRTDPVTGRQDPMPGGPPPVGVGPGGTLMKRPVNDPDNPDRTECERDQMELSMIDDAEYFRDLFGEANRANVSFYPIDPRGLAASDSSINENVGVIQDAQNLHARNESLHLLALNTDGLAMVASNDLRKEFSAIADDLTSYYLLGYYSTNAKLDGRYRTIKVRSKRPGISIRARQGYRAASEKDVNAAKAASDVAVPEAKAAVTRAIGTIETDARAQGRTPSRAAGEPLVFHRGPSTGNQMQLSPGHIFPRSDRVHLELEAAVGAPVWAGVLLDRNGTKTAVPVTVGERTDAATGQRWLTADITLAPLGAGDYVVELASTVGTEQKRTLVPIRVTQQ